MAAGESEDPIQSLPGLYRDALAARDRLRAEAQTPGLSVRARVELRTAARLIDQELFELANVARRLVNNGGNGGR